MVQADSFSFEYMGMYEDEGLEVEMKQLRQLVVAVVRREEVGCVSGSGGETVDTKVGKAMR